MSEIKKALIRKIPKELNPEEWSKAVHEDSKRDAITFLHWIFGFLIVTTVIVIFLQGFHAGGFALSASFFSWLGSATIGAVAGLLMVSYRSLFR